MKKKAIMLTIKKKVPGVDSLLKAILLPWKITAGVEKTAKAFIYHHKALLYVKKAGRL